MCFMIPTDFAWLSLSLIDTDAFAEFEDILSGLSV